MTIFEVHYGNILLIFSNLGGDQEYVDHVCLMLSFSYDYVIFQL